MIVGGTGNPSVKLNEVFRLQPTLVGLLGFFTRDLLALLGITWSIGYVFPLWYVSCLSRKPSVSIIIVGLACLGLIAETALPLTLSHHTYSSNLLLKQGTI